MPPTADKTATREFVMNIWNSLKGYSRWY